MAKFKVGDRVKSSGMRGVFVVKRVMRAGDFSFDSNLKAEAEKAYANGDVGYEVYDEDDSDEVTYLFEKDDRLTLANSRACNASAKIVTAGNFGTLKVGDRVDFRKSRYWRGTGVVTKVYGDGIIDVKGDNGEGEMEIHEEDIMNSRVRSRNAVVAKALNAVVAKALNACARNGAYDTLEIRKDPKYGNNWCIYQEGVSVRAVPRVFDTPESAKKYIREQMSAWSGAKVRVKNACGTARNAWGDETQVNGLITKMLGLINKIKPIAQQLYDTAFELDDAGSVWLGQNKGSENAQKVKVAVDRANKVMKRLANFTSGLD